VPAISPGKGLFRSHEFRSTLKSLPNWTRAMGAAESQTEAFFDCDAKVEVCSSAAPSWQKIIRQSLALPGREQLTTVKSYLNRWPYQLDIVA